MMIVGTAVMAAPTFLLAIGPTPWTLFGYLVLMTIGEAMWQPRFLQYAAEIAPEGRTGAYMGVAQFPWFLTKMITSLYSGWFLSRYCPPEGPQNTERMWLIYGFIADLVHADAHPRPQLARQGLQDQVGLEVQLGDDGKVVAREAGEAQAAAVGGEETDGAAEVDAVEAARGRERGERADGAAAARAALGRAAEAEDLGEDRRDEVAPVVEVAGDYAGAGGRERDQLVGPGQDPHLPHPLAGREAEMDVEHLDLDRPPGVPLDAKGRVLASPGPPAPDGQVDVPLPLDREAREGRVPVPAAP